MEKSKEEIAIERELAAQKHLSEMKEKLDKPSWLQ